MHAAAYRFVAAMVLDHELNRPGLAVCELGSYDVNGSVRELFDRCASYTGVDTRPGPGVDVVADAGLFNADELYDVVVTTEVLEHCPHWQLILSNAYELLKPSGVLIVTAAGPERAPHGCDGGHVGGEHYGGIAPHALLDALRCFVEGGGAAVVQENESVGDVYALALKGDD